MIAFESTLGKHISRVCQEAIALANEHQDSVAFTFNDVEMVVGPGESVEAAVALWQDRFGRNAEAYRNSPEGKAAQANQDAQRVRSQRETTDLISQLPNVIHDLPALVRWCVALSKSADHVGIKWDKSGVADMIEVGGWKRNAHVGRPKKAFDNPTTMGEYIVGQAIDNLRQGMPPHPVIERFAKQGGFLS